MVDLLATLKEVEYEAGSCQKCGLYQGRHSVVFGDGNPASPLMLVGEGPGAQEDQQGIPFVGPAGRLLDRILDAAEIGRSNVYICNVVKCRPQNMRSASGGYIGGNSNRPPNGEEIKACLPWLEAQIALIQPKIIVCLGSISAKTLIEPNFSIIAGRGKWVEKHGVKIMPTFHPSALLRDPSKKRPAWDDFQRVRDAYREITGAVGPDN
ncbi:hypothetical protein SY88_09210 [Clostridiales bacterium PH28_bin88]|nr:hypothetical protein SY88_09210 [Clostridiales bacterium PH28_bin88]